MTFQCRCPIQNFIQKNQMDLELKHRVRCEYMTGQALFYTLNIKCITNLLQLSCKWNETTHISWDVLCPCSQVRPLLQQHWLVLLLHCELQGMMPPCHSSHLTPSWCMPAIVYHYHLYPAAYSSGNRWLSGPDESQFLRMMDDSWVQTAIK